METDRNPNMSPDAVLLFQDMVKQIPLKSAQQVTELLELYNVYAAGLSFEDRYALGRHLINLLVVMRIINEQMEELSSKQNERNA